MFGSLPALVIGHPVGGSAATYLRWACRALLCFWAQSGQRVCPWITLFGQSLHSPSFLRRSRFSRACTRESSRFSSSVSWGLVGLVVDLRLAGPARAFRPGLAALRFRGRVLPALAGLGRMKVNSKVPPIAHVCGLVVRVIIYLGVFLVWALFVVIVVARMVERDMAESSNLVLQQTGPLAEQVHRLREEHRDLIADVGLKVEDLERRARSTFERLGVDLAPKSVSLRARTIFGAVGMPAPVLISDGSKWARLRRWLLHRLRGTARRVWEVIYGKPARD